MNHHFTWEQLLFRFGCGSAALWVLRTTPYEGFSASHAEWAGSMPVSLDQVCCASLPLAALPALADLRRDPDIRVAVVGARAWVRWEAGDESVLRRVLPLRGVELFAQHEG